MFAMKKFLILGASALIFLQFYIDSASGQEFDSEDEVEEILPSPDALTTVLFPGHPERNLPAGKRLDVIIGLHNKGPNAFIVQTIDASFRYYMDYNYIIQNFTGVTYSAVVRPGVEHSFLYSLQPHADYGGRPFGFTILMNYKDAYGKQHADAVFNKTVTFSYADESIDGESLSFYAILVGIAILVIFGLNYALGNLGIMRGLTASSAPEQGTKDSRKNIDSDWLPQETTNGFKKFSPRPSPRVRKVDKGEVS